MVCSCQRCDSQLVLTNSKISDNTELDQNALEQMMHAVEILLKCVGEDPSREGLIDTPRRVAKAWIDMTSGVHRDHRDVFGSALFHETRLEQSPQGMVIVRDIAFAALSSTNLLPFYGVCHIAYIPQNGLILGLSKLARVARCLASRIQSQEQFTRDLLEAVASHVAPVGAAAIVQARHFSESGGTSEVATMTVAASGCFEGADSDDMMELKALLGCDDINGTDLVSMNGHSSSSNGDQISTSSSSSDHAGVSSEMVDAVTVLLRCALRDANESQVLQFGSRNFVSWLLDSTSGYKMDSYTKPTSTGSTEETDSCSSSSECPLEAKIQQLVSSSGNNHQTIRVVACPFVSLCEHHMLPFNGFMRLAFICKPGQTAVDNPQLVFNHIVRKYAKRLQVQERLTQQVADDAVTAFSNCAESLVVLCTSSHMCMVARGVEEHTSRTITTAVRGKLSEEADHRRLVIGALAAV